MDKLEFALDIKPRGKDRPRFRKVGKYVTTYTTKATKDYENAIKNAFLDQCKGLDDKEYSDAIKVKIWAYFKPPKSYSKKKYNELLGKPHLKTPDSDNIAKSVCDALNKVAWKDDSQIYDIQVFKYYDTEDKLIVEINYE